MSQRHVSILTPCYNGGKYIHKLLDSVLDQTYPNIEMFVIDDGSTDNSAKTIKSYIPKFEKNGYKLEYIYQKNHGQSVAINNGLKLIRGDYIVWPDADDYYSDASAISEMVKALETSDDNTSMVRVQYNVLDENGGILDTLGVTDDTRYKTDLFEDAIFGTNGFWYPPGGYMAKVSKLDALVPGREIYTEKNAGQNFQLYLPLMYEHKCLTIEKNLYNIVAHEDSHSRNMSTNNDRQKVNYRVIKRTLNSISLPENYRKQIEKKVRAKTLNVLTPKHDKNYRTWVKKSIKGALPHGVIILLRKKGLLKQVPPSVEVRIQEPTKTTLDIVSDYDNKIFESGFAHNDFNKTNLDSWMLFSAHVLEKAMSRKNFEPGHNILRLEHLVEHLRSYELKKYDKNSFAYKYALSSIKEYITLHEKNNFSTLKIKGILGSRYDEVIKSKVKLAGYKVIKAKDKIGNGSLNFAELQKNRFSVREYSDKLVKPADIRKVIDLCAKTPSVCNRQNVRVYNIMDSKKIKQILAIQGGFGGYKMPPCLLLVTSDTQSFIGENERNQGFIDGGLYSMSLLLSLEYYGLAACPLNAMLMPETDMKIKEITGITNPEYLIMFIAAGHFMEENNVAVSSRYPSQEISKGLL